MILLKLPHSSSPKIMKSPSHINQDGFSGFGKQFYPSSEVGSAFEFDIKTLKVT